MDRLHFLQSLSLSPLLLGMNSLHSLENFASSLPLSERMPLLFIGHGSPMNALEDNQFVRGFQKIAKEIPKPKAILCVSAHWYIAQTKLTAMAHPKTNHDFGGFPEALYQVQYPVPGDVTLAKEVEKMYAKTDMLDYEWGLDHGAWTVLIHMYPAANIPTIQMSIDYTLSPLQHYELAQRLTSLRDKGILIIGSGNIVHNLREISWENMNTDNYGYDWAHEVHQKVNQYVMNYDFNPLIQYQQQGSAFLKAIPSPDHYLPLLYILGLAQKNEPIKAFNDKLMAGSLSMTSYRIG